MPSIVKMLTVLIITIIGRFIEHSRPIIINKCLTTKAIYNIFNINLPLSLGMIGWAWVKWPDKIPYFFILLLIGCVSRGFFSLHRPDRLFCWNDRDSRCGLIIPTACGLTSFVFGISLIIKDFLLGA